MALHARQRLCLIVLGVVCSAAPAAPSSQAAGQPPPVFRSGVQLLEVDVVATDAQGRPVMDLRQEEFELYDEGERQAIAFFTTVSLPIVPPHAPVLRDVASNVQAEDGRLFVLILDDIHSFRTTTATIQAAARRLVERLSPQDQIAVLWMSTDKHGAFEFTSAHGHTLAAIDDFFAAKARVERVGGRGLSQSVRAEIRMTFKRSLKGCGRSRWSPICVATSRRFPGGGRRSSTSGKGPPVSC